MSYQSPLARLPIKRSSRRPYKSPPAPVPEYIQLPDGRRVATKELLNQQTRPEIINLRSGRIMPRKVTDPYSKPYVKHNSLFKYQSLDLPEFPRSTQRTLKYSIKERQWMADHQPEDIMVKYEINLTAAKALRYQSRYMLDNLINKMTNNDNNIGLASED